MNFETVSVLIMLGILLLLQLMMRREFIKREAEMLGELRWYAEESRYDSTPGITDVQTYRPAEILLDRGRRARKVIRRLEEGHRDTSKARSARHPDETDG